MIGPVMQTMVFASRERTAQVESSIIGHVTLTSGDDLDPSLTARRISDARRSCFQFECGLMKDTALEVEDWVAYYHLGYSVVSA